jgi:hypothetical protein
MLPVNMLKNGTVIEQTDDALAVRFFMLPERDEVKSAQEGRPIYHDIEMVEILIPGSRDKLHRKVNDLDKQRFRTRYEKFKQSITNQIEGTPLNQFPFISVAEIKELEYFNVFTGEQLALIPDGNIDKIGVNGRDLIKKVKNYMQAAKDTAFVSKMTHENESLKREISLLKEQMQQILQMKEDSGVPAKLKKAKGSIKNGNE